MKKMMWVFALVLFAVVMAWAADVVCPLHYNAPCYSTGQYRMINGRGFVKYHCSCGDEYWVAQ